MRWKNLTVAAAGTKHVLNGTGCEDAVDSLIISNVLIGVVCDGAGSAKYAAIGSKLVAETTAIALSKELRNLQFIRIFGILKLRVNDRSIKKLFDRILNLNLQVLGRKANELDCDINDLATTLIAFVATPHWVASMQIGDGFIVFREEESEEYKLVHTPEKGEYLNATTFVSSRDAFERMKVAVVTGPIQFVCASSDGLERLALKWSSTITPFEGFFKGVEAKMRMDKPGLEEWLRRDPTLAKKTDDDRSIVVGVR